MQDCRIGPVVIALVFLAVGIASAVQELYVQVRFGELRAKPSFLGQVTGKVPYGTGVAVSDERGPWRLVQARGQSGWLHVSALTKEKLAPLRAGDADVLGGVSGEEVALASKGFTEEVEREWRQQHGESGYAWVDRMESFVVPPQESAEFLEAGHVSPREGGAP